MDYAALMALLSQVPKARAITVKGRTLVIVSCSIPDGALPAGWHRVNENKVQHRPGWQRVRFGSDPYGEIFPDAPRGE